MKNNDYFYNNYPNNIYAQDGQPLSTLPPMHQTAASQLCVQTMNAPALPQQYEQPPIHQMSAPPLPQPQIKQSIQVQPLLPVLEESPNKQSEERLKPPIDESTSQPHNTETASENVTSADKQKLLCKDLSLITPGSKEYNKLSPKAQKSCDKWFLQSVKEEERSKQKSELTLADSGKKLLCVDFKKIKPGSPVYDASTPETKEKADEYYLRKIKMIQEAKESSMEVNDSCQSIVPAVQPVAIPNSNLQQNYISCCNPTTNSFSFEINEFGVTELNTGISCNFHIEITTVYLLLGDNNSPTDLPGFLKTFSEKTNTPVVSQSSEALGALLADNGYCEVYYEKEGNNQKRRLSKKQGKVFGEHRLMRIYYQKLCEYERNNSLGF